MVMKTLRAPAVSVHPLDRTPQWLPPPLPCSHSETNLSQSSKGCLYTSSTSSVMLT